METPILETSSSFRSLIGRSRSKQKSANSLTGFSDFFNKGISKENLSVRENEDRDNIWNHYKKIKVIDKKEISIVSLIRRKKSKRHWKQWRKDFEFRKSTSNRSNFSNISTSSLTSSVNSSLEDSSIHSVSSSISGNSSSSLRKSGRFGSFSSLRLLFQKGKGKDRFYALKMIKLYNFNEKNIKMLKREVGIMKTLDHPYIVKAYETFEVPKSKLYIVMELCCGGNLWSKAPCTEKDASRIMGQLMSAVTYMHDHGIIHRDLKLENVLFESDEPNSDIKIIDFGLSTKFTDESLTARVGTVYAMSPELIKREYSSKADTWACGVIAFSLIAKRAPFISEKKKNSELMEIISKGKFEFLPTDVWENISEDAKEFISQLLQRNPSDRLSAEQALNHKWIKTLYPLKDRRPSQSVMEGAHHSLSQLCVKRQTLKSLALHIIASRSSAKETEEFRQVFDQYDSENNGTVSYEEFKAALSPFNFTDQELAEKFERIAFTSGRLIYYTDFIAALLHTKDDYLDEEKLADAFDILDCDDSGYISQENLRHFLDGKCFNDIKIKEILNEADFNGDGYVTFEDFLEMFLDKGGGNAVLQ